MKKTPNAILPCEVPMSSVDFLESYNQNMPQGYPHASLALMEKFKSAHQSLFKNDLWSLDLHRKRLIHWLPQNI